MLWQGNQQAIPNNDLNDQLYTWIIERGTGRKHFFHNISNLISSGADVNFRHWTGSTPLLIALENNLDTDAIDTLLQNKADVNIPGKDGLTPLEVAASKGRAVTVNRLCLFGAKNVNKALTSAAEFNHLQVIRCLIQAHKADVNNTEVGGWTPLAKAVSINKKSLGNNSSGVAKSLVNEDTDVNKLQINGKWFTDLKSLSNNSLDVTKSLVSNGNTSKCSRSDYLKVATCLVDEGADVNKLQANGNTALTEAVKAEHKDVVVYLLSVGADLNIVGEGGMTPLGAAAMKGLLEIVQSFSEKGADLNKCDPQGNTSLTHAAEGGHEDVVRHLTEKGADVDKAETGGQTPLAAAASKGHLNIVKLLVENRTNLNPNIGDNPLIVATKNGHREVAKYLVSEGANVNKTDASKNYSLLFAVENSDFELTEFFLNHGGSYMVHSVFLNAVSKPNFKIVELLVQKGANVNMKYKSDVSPLIKAIRSNQHKITEVLLDNGASIDTPDSKGNLPTAIFLETYCIQKKHSQVIRLLIGKGLSSSTFCKCGYSLLTKFVQMDDYEMTSFLVGNSADLNQKDNHGNLPLTVAASNTNYQIIDFLIESGADIDLAKEKFEEIAKDDISFSIYLESLRGPNNARKRFKPEDQ